jgi:hypothetical protein
MLFAQGAPPADPDPELPGQLKEFKDAIDAREGAEDAKATALIDGWLSKYESYAPKDKEQILKSLDLALTSTKVKRPPEKIGLYTAAATALGRMEDAGAKLLRKAFDSPKFKKREWVNVRAVLLKQIGKTKDDSPATLKLLLNTAERDPEDALMAAAGEALGNYADLPLDRRKDIVKDLVKKFGEVHGKANASLDPGDAQTQRSKQTLAAISDPWNTTLAGLTKRNDIRTAPDWQNFWNKHKGDDWDNMK